MTVFPIHVGTRSICGVATTRNQLPPLGPQRGRKLAPVYSFGADGKGSPLPSGLGPDRSSSSASTSGWSPLAAAPVTTTTRPDDDHYEWPCLQPPFYYFASAEDAQSNAVPSGLSPIWKVLLLSDGSVTRHLQLLSGSPVTVECLSMRNVGWSLEGLPPGADLIPGPRVQRQVLLRCCESERLNAGIQTSTGGPRESPAGSRESEDLVSSNNKNSTDTERSSSSTPSPGMSDSGSSGGGGPQRPVGQPLVYASSWWNAETVDEYLRDKSKPIWISLSQGHVELYREVHSLFRGDSSELEELLGCQGPFWGRQYTFWSGGRPLTLIYEVFSPRLQQYLGPEEL